MASGNPEGIAAHSCLPTAQLSRRRGLEGTGLALSIKSNELGSDTVQKNKKK